MYYAAKVIGQIFANPPFHVLKCVISTENWTKTDVVKGDIVGPTTRGTVLCFDGKPSTDKNGRKSIEIKRGVISPSLLRGEARENFLDWTDPEHRERIELLSKIIDSGCNARLVNSIWSLIRYQPEKIKENPWSLVSKGLNFEAADNLARMVLKDFDPLNINRVGASAFWSVSQGINQGHCYLDANSVFHDVSALTGLRDPAQIASSVKALKERGDLIVDKDEAGKRVVYLPSYHRMESEVADFLRSSSRESEDKDISDEEIQSYSRFNLTSTQIEGVRRGLTDPVTVITGLPGVGKTTILSTLCKMLKVSHKSVLLVAPTGIAAKRAQALTGIEAQTIHRAFGAGAPDEDKEKSASDYEGVKKSEDDFSTDKSASKIHSSIWRHNPENPRGEQVIIIDEASMVDLHLMWRILRGISPSCRVVMVGDIEQLPPVGAGFSLKDIIDSGVIPRIHLTEIFRQGEGSAVVRAAHAIHRGESPTFESEDFTLIEESSLYGIQHKVVGVCKELLLEGKDYHVISPTHHGPAGVTALNRALRAELNPNIMGRSLKVGRDDIRIGDKVMITQNDYDLGVFNGDIGRVESIGRVVVRVSLKTEGASLRIDLPVDRIGSLLRLAYATTVHKSQGQEYSTIVMPLTLEHGSFLLQRSLLYTAVTRAKEKVILVGEQGAISTAVKNASSAVRYSLLSHRLRKDYQPSLL